MPTHLSDSARCNKRKKIQGLKSHAGNEYLSLQAILCHLSWKSGLGEWKPKNEES